MITAIAGFFFVLLMVFVRVPIAIAMAVVGFVGFALLRDWMPALSLVGLVARTTVESYELSVVPLFILMGNFVSRAGISHDLYTASYAFVGHRKGGLAMATIVACGGFSAVCGSSLATAATMARVAAPPMKHYGYADTLAAGSIAAGGTLGILIPPSVILVLYGIITQTDIRALFMAGMVPGLLGAALYLAAIRWVVWRNPDAGPAGDRLATVKQFAALRGVWPMVLLFIIVIGGIYVGIFTPTESAGIGAFGALIFAVARRRLDWRSFMRVVVDTAVTTASLFMVLIGALIFANFINGTGMPAALTQWVTAGDMSPMVVLLLIVLVYLMLGCVLESMSMLLLTIPVFSGLVASLDFGLGPQETLIWFGIIVVVATEISLITPPIGMNVFTLSAMLPEISTRDIFRGVTPFWCADIVRLALLIAIPALSLFVPALL